MKKFRILPLIAIATLGGMTLPLVSCKKGGDEPEPIDPLCFTTDKEVAKISYVVNGSLDIDIEYKWGDDGTWTDWGPEEELSINEGQKLYVKNSRNELSKGEDNFFQFIINNEEIKASGDINSMINYGELTKYCFYSIFRDCTALKTAPALPATKLSESCYCCMFHGCYGLTVAPELSAMELAVNCYSGMFEYCSNLIQPPTLPAKTMVQFCYWSMFYDCALLNVSQDDGKTCFLDLTNVEMSRVDVISMFEGTGGTFQDTPSSGHKYYWN